MPHRPRRHRIALALVTSTALALAASVTTAQAVQSAPQRKPKPVKHSTVVRETQHDLSRALRSVAPVPTQTDDEAEPVRHVPHPLTQTPDLVVQGDSASVSAPTSGTGFEGLGTGFTGPAGAFQLGTIPPDPNSAVGTTQLVEIVNSGFAVFSKSGTVLYGPANTNTLFTGFGGACETTDNGDAIVRYDALANRWVITQFALPNEKAPYYECVAVSQTGDATGAYNRYAFEYSAFPDYPKLAVWPDAYYLTYNTYDDAGTFLGAQACALDRAAMLAGRAATQQCFVSPTSGSVLAADLDSAVAPPAGADNVQLALGPTTDTLSAWRFHVDWANPAATRRTGPTSVPIAAYSAGCEGSCVPQAGTSTALDAISDRLMFRLAYRNLGDHQSLVVSHAVGAGGTVGQRWYELRLDPVGNPAVAQQGTFAPDATYRWLGSIALDSAGNIGLGYSASSESTTPQIRYTGRLATDPPGTMTQGETTVVTSVAPQTQSDRWGDYSSMSVDPVDGCTFWYTNEYVAANGLWKTRNTSFVLPRCGTTPAGVTNGGFESGLSGWVAAGDTGAVPSPVHGGAYAARVGGILPSTDSSLRQAFTVPAGVNQLSFSYEMTCPDSVAYDWFTVALTDETTGATSTPLTHTCATHTGYQQVSVPVTSGHRYTLSLQNHDDDYAGDASFTYVDDVVLTTAAVSGVVNGNFETGTLSGWATAGATSVVSAPVRGGTSAARIGSTSPTTDSSLSQSFTVPAGATQLSFAYAMSCPDTVEFDWFTATLTDATTGAVVTPLPHTCATQTAFPLVRVPVVAGHRYTLALQNHDDNFAGDESYATVDDVTLG